MKTLYNPRTGSPVQVPDDRVKAWTDQGWRKTPPNTDTDKPSPATGEDEKKEAGR